MIVDIDKIPEKYEVGFHNVKYPFGAMNLIYSLRKNELLAKISKNQEDIFFSFSLAIHEMGLSNKLRQKGYPVPNFEGIYKIFHKDLEEYLPGFVMEDKHNFIMLRNVPWTHHNYFLDYYHETLGNIEKEGFVIGDTNEGNCLCDLRNKKICLIDFEDWDYLGKGKHIISPRCEWMYQN